MNESSISRSRYCDCSTWPVIVATWLSSAATRWVRSATGLVAGRPGTVVSVSGVICASKVWPAPPGKTLRWTARISRSSRSTRASTAVCASAGLAAASAAEATAIVITKRIHTPRGWKRAGTPDAIADTSPLSPALG
ncbi:MAG: hypothetical protein WDN24_21755 [Sphingomonas sp.]